jgi:phosphatidate cytidylyltransferase
MAQAAIFGLLMAIFGHLGDLVESAIKRDIGQKDSARVVPAFGGLLDIIDSPLFTAPVAWWVLTNWVRH